MRVAAALVVVTGLSVLLRTGGLDAGFWIDEAIAVGIASHPPAEIPALLRQDGSPPLYYLLLHAWISLAGEGEAAARSLSLLFAAVAVPVAWWAAAAVGGRRAGAVAAATVAVGPFFSYYAQEARMYTLVADLSLVAAAAFALAFLRGRRRHLVTLAAALVLLLYTHTWGVFLAAGLGVAWLWLWRGGRVGGRDGALVGAAVAALAAPWAPSLAFQALHTGAPWSVRPSPLYLLAALAVAAAAARGPREGAASRPGGGTPSRPGGDTPIRPGGDPPRRRGEDAARVLALAAAAAVALAWLASQVQPAWSPRYLAVVLGPALVAAACLAARRAAVAAATPLALVAVAALAGPPVAKSNARAVAASVAQSVRAGDLVLCTQPEQVPVLHRYLPDGVAYLTPLGTPADPTLTDWRDALGRLRAARAATALAPVRALAPGRRVVLVTPVARDARSPWARAVARHTREWRAALRADPRLRPLGATSRPDPARFRSAVRAEIFAVGGS